MRRLPLSIHIHSSSSHCITFVRSRFVNELPSDLVPLLISRPLSLSPPFTRIGADYRADRGVCALCPCERDGLRFNKPNDPDYEDYEKECQILLDETSHVHGWVTSAVEPVVLRVRWWVGGCGCVGSSRVTPRAVPRER